MTVTYYTEAEVRRIRDDEYKRGYAAGRQRGYRYRPRQDQHQLEHVLQDICTRLEILEDSKS